MTGYLVRWKHPQYVYQHGEPRFDQEQPAVWETYACRERGCQATCFEVANDGTEEILPIITWRDRMDMAVFRTGVHRADGTTVSPYMIRVIEGGAGAVDVACYWASDDDPWGKELGKYKPNWRVKRWVTGRITTEGALTPATEAIARMVALGDWQPMSWRAWAASGVQRRDEAAGELFAATSFAQTPMPMFAEVPA